MLRFLHTPKLPLTPIIMFDTRRHRHKHRHRHRRACLIRLSRSFADCFFLRGHGLSSASLMTGRGRDDVARARCSALRVSGPRPLPHAFISIGSIFPPARFTHLEAGRQSRLGFLFLRAFVLTFRRVNGLRAPRRSVVSDVVTGSTVMTNTAASSLTRAHHTPDTHARRGHFFRSHLFRSNVD